MISIVIPLYNKSKCIEKCIESVLSQSLNDWELVIIDDGSTDNSCNIVEKYLEDKRIRLIRQSNRGVSNARNHGIKEAKGEWIVFIDADDSFLPNALKTLYDTAINNKTLISTANFIVRKGDNDFTFCKGKKERLISNNYRAWFFKTIYPRTGAALFHSSILKEHLFDESLCRYEDAKSLFDIFRKYKISYTPWPVMIYSLDNNGLSRKSNDIKKDFIFSMNFENKSIWEKVVLYELLLQGYILYPEYKNILDNSYKNLFFVRRITKILMLVRRIHNKLL